MLDSVILPNIPQPGILSNPISQVDHTHTHTHTKSQLKTMTPIADLIVLPNIPQVRALSNPLPQVGQARCHLKFGNTEYTQT